MKLEELRGSLVSIIEDYATHYSVKLNVPAKLVSEIETFENLLDTASDNKSFKERLPFLKFLCRLILEIELFLAEKEPNIDSYKHLTTVAENLKNVINFGFNAPRVESQKFRLNGVDYLIKPFWYYGRLTMAKEHSETAKNIIKYLLKPLNIAETEPKKGEAFFQKITLELKEYLIPIQGRTIKKLNESANQLTNTNNTLLGNKQSQEQTILQLQAQIVQLKLQNEQFQQQLTDNQNTMQQMAEDAQKTETAFKELQSNYQCLQEKFDSEKTLFEEDSSKDMDIMVKLLNEKESFQAQITDLESAIESKENIIEALEDQKNSYVDQIGVLASTITNLEVAKNYLEEEKLRMHNVAQEATQKIKDLGQHITLLGSKLSAGQESIKTLTLENELLKHKDNANLQEITKLKNEIEKNNSIYAQSENARMQLEKRVEEQLSKISQLQQQITKLQAQKDPAPDTLSSSYDSEDYPIDDEKCRGKILGTKTTPNTDTASLRQLLSNSISNSISNVTSAFFTGSYQYSSSKKEQPYTLGKNEP